MQEVFQNKIIDKDVIFVVKDICNGVNSFSYNENECFIIVLNSNLKLPLNFEDIESHLYSI